MIKLSIITINYNNKEGLARTINSVVQQSYTNFEYIIIDGNSTDGSLEIIKTHEKKISYWVSEKDSGIYNAMNKGIAKATGDYYLFLNSGDYLKDKDVIRDVFEKPNYGAALILYGDLLLADGHGKLKLGKMPEKLSVYQFMIGTLWHPVSFISATLFQKYGCYDESFKIVGDYDFFLKTIIKHGIKTHYLSKVITVFNTEGIGSSDEQRQLQEAERHRSLSNNLSPLVLEMAIEYTKIVRSSSYKLACKIKDVVNKIRLK